MRLGMDHYIFETGGGDFFLQKLFFVTERFIWILFHWLARNFFALCRYTRYLFLLQKLCRSLPNPPPSKCNGPSLSTGYCLLSVVSFVTRGLRHLVITPSAAPRHCWIILPVISVAILPRFIGDFVAIRPALKNVNNTSKVPLVGPRRQSLL